MLQHAFCPSSSRLLHIVAARRLLRPGVQVVVVLEQLLLHVRKVAIVKSRGRDAGARHECGMELVWLQMGVAY
eukprot:CAMPEP_0167791506 /NCGR_PEP_ID=MMETSP0111_2-20121227/11982_1 /TAXON_ID=91324 /ORGANISM="Lotharella globosa, Strain CCCM811" /LENGTH=72 /DNA_ID=CAMNT_0007684199 /DNA_START=64 /DNA_END=282 /DNA_ORIENTATION=+